MNRTLTALASILGVFALHDPTRAADDINFDDFSIEELTSLEVTTAAKRPQRVGDTASAIYVITSDDMRRSGHASVPEALRLVPGMQVERVSSGLWSISARGFEEVFANKLLVLIDGRTVYSSLFSGTFWELQTPPLDDIDRIEVIRGPGATLWGANAVNGVINIITKSAHRTHGSRISVITGNEDKLLTEMRHGFTIGENASARISGMLSQSDAGFDANTHSAARDGARHGQVSSRLDWSPTKKDHVQLTFGGASNDTKQKSLTFRSDYSDPNPFGTLIDDRKTHKASFGNGIWKHEFSEANSVELTGYFTRDNRNSEVLGNVDRTLDLGFQQNLEPTDAHRLVWGAEYRTNYSKFDNSNVILFNPRSDTIVQYSAFAQDEFRITRSLQFTAGSKVSWNDFTGYEIQPSARTLWKPTADQSVWAAVSRSVRTPSRGDRNRTFIFAAFPLPFPPFAHVPVGSTSDPHARSEGMVAYELGYRTELTPQLSVDSTVFTHQYDHLIPGVEDVALTTPNREEDRSNGAEVFFNWFPVHGTRVWGSWSTIHFHNTDRTPNQNWQLHSSFDLTPTVELDLGLYYSGRKELFDVGTRTYYRVSSHARTDARIGWTPTKSWTLALVGQNLLDGHHFENVQTTLPPVEIQRSVFAQASYSF
jgi:iron complex outermembrane recepter protein